MKKLFLVFLTSLLLGGVAYAEIGATAYTGSSLIATQEQPVYILAYNNSSTSFLGTSHSVVVLDTSYTTASTTSVPRASNAVGTWFTTTTTADDELVLGITDGPIAAGAVGKIIVRGPAKVELIDDSTRISDFSAGVTIATSTTAGQAICAGVTDGTMPGFVIGTLIAPSSDKSTVKGDGVDQNSIARATEESDSTSSYIWWAWIGKE